MSQNATDLIKLHEGLENHVYYCPSGKETIGYGRNISESGPGITTEEAEFLLNNDIEKCIADLEQYTCFSQLSEVRQAVLIDMRYNLGLRGLLSFKNLHKELDRKEYCKAAEEMLDSKWARQVSIRAHRLANMMLTDAWPDEIEYDPKG